MEMLKLCVFRRAVTEGKESDQREHFLSAVLFIASSTPFSLWLVCLPGSPRRLQTTHTDGGQFWGDS